MLSYLPKRIYRVALSVVLLLIISIQSLSAAAAVEEDLSFGIWEILQILGALSFFIFGMKMMSEGIQRAAGSQMRSILRSMTKNRYFGVLTGFFITALVQSSSATTVMTVSFVNAGLLSLVESAGVMMGANIGTTVTGWVVSLLGFKLNLATYSIPIFAFGLPMLFSKHGKLKYWGEFLIGFAILFLGLSYLKESVPDLKNNPEVLTFLGNFTDWGFFSRLFFVFVGALVTIIVQSSSAAMAITLTLCAQGILPFEVAAAMILGENVGTTITAELASLVGNTNAKRSARIHSMFNIIGVTWMVILLPVILPILSNVVQDLFGIADPFKVADDMPIALSAFHTFFNLTNVLVLLPFVPWLVRMAIKTVPKKEGEEELQTLQFIDTRNKTPELATAEIQKEVARYGEITSRMLEFTKKLLNSTKNKERAKMIDRLKKYEEVTDKFEEEIIEYATKLSDQEMTQKTSVRLRSFMNICNDMERIGDIFDQVSKKMEYNNANMLYFFPEQREELNKLIDIVELAFEEMNKNLNIDSYDDISLVRCYELEEEINVQRNKMRTYNEGMLKTENYDPNSALIFTNLFSSIERIGDHIVNITESAAGEI